MGLRGPIPFTWLTTKYYTFNGQRIAMSDETGLYYLHQDQLGSTLLVTNGSDNTVDGHGCYAYGRDRRGTELRNLQRFTGRTAAAQMNADCRRTNNHPRLSVHPRFSCGVSITTPTATSAIKPAPAKPMSIVMT